MPGSIVLRYDSQISKESFQKKVSQKLFGFNPFSTRWVDGNTKRDYKKNIGNEDNLSAYQNDLIDNPTSYEVTQRALFEVHDDQTHVQEPATEKAFPRRSTLTSVLQALEREFCSSESSRRLKEQRRKEALEECNLTKDDMDHYST